LGGGKTEGNEESYGRGGGEGYSTGTGIKAVVATESVRNMGEPGGEKAAPAQGNVKKQG